MESKNHIAPLTAAFRPRILSENLLWKINVAKFRNCIGTFQDWNYHDYIILYVLKSADIKQEWRGQC